MMRTPILVTGAHRTGTTWVGKMLAASDEVAYISEPLNVWHRPGVMRVSVKHWYSYICEENEAELLPAFREMLRFEYHFGRELKALRSFRDVLRMGRDGWIFLNGRLRRQRPLIKDPFAVFSIPWFVKRLECQVVVTIRHPAGFASSLKRLGWRFGFKNLLEQPLLIRDYLEPYVQEMCSLPKGDVIAQAGLLWKLIYQQVYRFWQEYPGQIYLAYHENLSTDPIAGYRALYDALGLSFTEKAQRRIRESSASENPSHLKHPHSIMLNSRASLENWRKILTPEEFRRLQGITADTFNLFYPADGW